MRRPRRSVLVKALAATLCGGLAVTVVANSAVGTAGGGTSQSLDAVRASNTTPFFTWSSSAGAAIRVSISTHGNVIEFKSPNNANNQYEHIGVGVFSEGYVLCYTQGTLAKNMWDTGDSESGFGAATTTTAPVAVSRSTTDGAMSLRQQFVFGPPEDKTLAISMTVKNTSGGSLSNVILSRQVDFDVDTGGSSGWSGFVHWHGRTNSSVMAWNDIDEAPTGRTSHAMLLRGIKPLPGATTQQPKITGAILDNSCSPTSLTGTVNGDFGDRIQYNMGSFAPGQSKTVTVQYLRF